jgi:hypothetical protein
MENKMQSRLERNERRVNELGSVVFAMAGSFAGYLAYQLIESWIGTLFGIVGGIVVALGIWLLRELFDRE